MTIALVAALAGVGLECGGTGSASDPLQAYNLTMALNPGAFELLVGDSEAVTATVTPAGDGATKYYSDQAVQITWTSSSDIIARVIYKDNFHVTVTCVAAGTATITAHNTEQHTRDYLVTDGTSVVTCDAPVAHVKVDSNPPPLAKALGSAASQLPAAATDASGNAVANATFTWTIVNPAIATVTSGGLMTPVSPGQTLVTATATGTTVSGTSPLYILGNGSCSVTPTSGVRSMTIAVQSDPGNHASAIGLSSTNVNWSWSTYQGAAYLIATVGFGSSVPWPRVDGGWVSPTDCSFAANGTMTVGSQQNVGVRVQGTWTNGTMTLTLTVGTNGELSGGATVYSVSG